jgi:hypothetical protein
MKLKKLLYYHHGYSCKIQLFEYNSVYLLLLYLITHITKSHLIWLRYHVIFSFLYHMLY